MRCRARWAILAVAVLGPPAGGGCAGNPFRTAGPAAPPSLEPPPGVAAPAVALPATTSMPSYVDADGRQLEGMLTRSRQESQVLQDEVTALREQLASTSAQLAQARASGSPPPAAGEPATPATGQVTPVVMRSAMSEIVLPDLEPRFDGAVVRIDVPADRLFEAGTANLLPGGVALLTQVTGEIERVYPGHFIGIEGHTDSEPLVSAAWATPHQFTTARAAAVFDFLTSRTPISQSRLFLVAHGANHPLVSNATPAGRAKNRRIELVVYPERAADDDSR